jgi:hypothetical protein
MQVPPPGSRSFHDRLVDVEQASQTYLSDFLEIDRLHSAMFEMIVNLQNQVDYLSLPWHKRLWRKVCSGRS